MTTLPPLIFQPLREDGTDTDEHDAAATGRTLQRKLEMHGVAHGRAVGVKRKSEGVGFSSSALLWLFIVFLACGTALALFLTLG